MHRRTVFAAGQAARSVVLCGVLGCVLSMSASGSLRADAGVGRDISGFVEGPNGAIYATTRAGGTADLGTVTRIANGQSSVLHSFAGSDGSAPLGGLVIGPDGALYGTTSEGGRLGFGTAFRITPDGAFSELHAFAIDDGGAPRAPLIFGRDGNLYGTTAGHSVLFNFSSGWKTQIFSYGAVFSLSPSGEPLSFDRKPLRVLHFFEGGEDGARPTAPLIQSSDGYLYGTTGVFITSDGLHDAAATAGSVFRLDPYGSYERIYSFQGTATAAPVGALVEADDGALYGLSAGYSAWMTVVDGAVFRIERDGANFRSLSTVAQGARAQGMVQGPDGFFYGTTAADGDNALGTLFRSDLNGNVTPLHAFTSAEDGPPVGPISRASDGSFLGATASTIYRATRDGTVTTLGRL